MKESYDEGLESHVGPESCVTVCKGRCEALTGVRAGRVLSREMLLDQGADVVMVERKAIADASPARDAFSPCAVGDPVARMETPRTGIGRSPGRLHKEGSGGRIGKSKDTSR